jgi:hypothetical protein
LVLGRGWDSDNGSFSDRQFLGVFAYWEKSTEGGAEYPETNHIHGVFSLVCWLRSLKLQTSDS